MKWKHESIPRVGRPSFSFFSSIRYDRWLEMITLTMYLLRLAGQLTFKQLLLLLTYILFQPEDHSSEVSRCLVLNQFIYIIVIISEKDDFSGKKWISHTCRNLCISMLQSARIILAQIFANYLGQGIP